MTNDIFIYEVDLPKNVNEMVTPCVGGYTIYINASLSSFRKKKAVDHAIHHIENNDFERHDIQDIEFCTHKEIV